MRELTHPDRADLDWSADSRVRAFLASDQVRADKAVRAPVSPLLESALTHRTGGLVSTRSPAQAEPTGARTSVRITRRTAQVIGPICQRGTRRRGSGINSALQENLRLPRGFFSMVIQPASGPLKK